MSPRNEYQVAADKLAKGHRVGLIRIATLVRLALSLHFVVLAGHADDSEPSGKPSRTLKEVINLARELPATSLHQWLRDENKIASGFNGGIAFEDAVKAAKAAKLPLLEGWENGSAILRRYKLRESVFKFPNGRTADAYLFFMAFNKKDGRYPFVAEKVRTVEIGLLVNVGLTYQQTIDQKIFADGTALRHSLELDEAKKAGASWPRLDRILIHYGQDNNRWLEFDPSGFFFHTKFDAPGTKDIGYCEIWGFTPSGLDPLRKRDGTPAPGDFIAADSLGESDYKGGYGYTELPEELKLKLNKAPAAPSVPKK